MKTLIEFVRAFFLSIELLILLGGVGVEFWFSDDISKILVGIKIADDPLKVVVAIPGALCGWMFVSGRKLLFPEKDKFSILQEWPDFWRLNAVFQAALVWSVVFAVLSIFGWVEYSSAVLSRAVVMLVVSILGSAACFYSVYNAQLMVEILVVQFKKKSG